MLLYKQILFECCRAKKHQEHFKKWNKNKISVMQVIVRHQMNDWGVTASAVVWRRRVVMMWLGQMADRFTREFQRLRHSHWRWHNALVECPARVLKQNGVAVESPCLPLGAVYVWGTAAGKGRPAQLAWTWSAAALVTSEGHRAVVWCGPTSELNIRVVQEHSSQIAVCPVECFHAG